MSNILITALAYAPFSGVGSARMTSLSDYLVKNGYNVTVIAYNCAAFGETECLRKVPDGINPKYIEKKSKKKENRVNIYDSISSTMDEKYFDLWIISVGPFEVMEVIHDIYKKYKIPYIIDYRDVWLFDTNKHKDCLEYRVKRFLMGLYCLPIEYNVMRHAERIVYVTNMCKSIINKRYKLQEKRTCVIYNGYEDKVEVNLETQKFKTELKLGIAGKFALYNRDAALDCIEACCECDFVQVGVTHIGLIDNELAENYPKNIYNGLGVRNHPETMKILSELDVMIISYQYEVGLGTKVFDYIALNKPIIYIGLPEAELATFLQQFENAYICTNKDDVLSAIWNIYVNDIKVLTSKETEIINYSREYQNEKYEELIEKLLTEITMKGSEKTKR